MEWGAEFILIFMPLGCKWQEMVLVSGSHLRILASYYGHFKPWLKDKDEFHTASWPQHEIFTCGISGSEDQKSGDADEELGDHGTMLAHHRLWSSRNWLLGLCKAFAVLVLHFRSGLLQFFLGMGSQPVSLGFPGKDGTPLGLNGALGSFGELIGKIYRGSEHFFDHFVDKSLPLSADQVLSSLIATFSSTAALFCCLVWRLFQKCFTVCLDVAGSCWSSFLAVFGICWTSIRRWLNHWQMVQNPQTCFLKKHESTRFSPSLGACEHIHLEALPLNPQGGD